MLFNYKDYVLCCGKLHLLGDHRQSHHNFPFLTVVVVLVAILHAGMKFCESYVVATVGLYM